MGERGCMIDGAEGMVYLLDEAAVDRTDGAFLPARGGEREGEDICIGLEMWGCRSISDPVAISPGRRWLGPASSQELVVFVATRGRGRCRPGGTMGGRAVSAVMRSR